MQLIAQMLREMFQQTQREILADGSPERYNTRWSRMAELLIEKLGDEQVMKEVVELLEKKKRENES
jgi:hypothetical protein